VDFTSIIKRFTQENKLANLIVKRFKLECKKYDLKKESARAAEEELNMINASNVTVEEKAKKRLEVLNKHYYIQNI
jgi:hypothetical protein